MADLTVRITATENASGAFKDVAKAAKTAADELEKAGTEGAKGLEKIEQEAKEAAPAIESVGESAKRANVDMQAMGAALAAMGAGLAYAGSLAMEHERVVIGLEKAYGDAAAGMIAFADTLSGETGNLFNDDDILAGERFFATLVNQYDLTIAQVQDLMRTTADLAAGAGIGFEDASNRITAAIRGEGEAAELLGLTMNQQAIDRENLTLTMSNQEAAQFRLTALNEQAAWSVGTAAAVAESSAGSWAALTNQMKDAAQSIGEFVGPQTAMLAGLGSGAVGLAQFAGGFAALASGIRIATTAAAAFALTPVGAAVAAVGIGLGVVTKLWMDNRAEAAATAQEWEDAAASAEVLADALDQLSAENWFEGQKFTSIAEGVKKEFDWLAEWLPTIASESFGTGNWFDTLVREQMAAADLDSIAMDSAAQWGTFADTLLQEMLPDGADYDKFNDAMINLLSLEDVLSPDLWKVTSKAIQELWASFNAADGAISVDQFNASLTGLFDRMTLAEELTGRSVVTNYDYSDAMGAVAAATNEATEAVLTYEETRAQMESKNQEYADRRQSDADLDRALWEDERAAREDQMAREAERREAFKASALERLELNSKIATVEIQNNRGITASINDVKTAYQDMAAARQEELIGMMQSLSGLDNPLDQWNATSGASPYSQMAADAIDAGEALDNLFRIVVSNTDAFASQVSGIDDWATALIGVSGEYAVIDDLLANGRITLDQYTAAQEAQISIAESNLAVQEHVQTIQAMQAPLIAESTAALETQLGVIAGYEPALQLTALAWMDSATAAKALEIATMATAVANGELGASGEEAFTKYLTGLAAVDPVMKSLLIDMGLIKEGANGEITVTMDGAEGAISDMDRLTSAIIMLLDFMDDQVINGSVSIDGVEDAIAGIQSVDSELKNLDGASSTVQVEGDNSRAISALGAAADALSALNGDTATTYATTVDNSSGVLGNVANLLNSLDGRSAVSTITTVFRTIGTPAGTGKLMGGVPGFADGGVTFYAGEGNRPELARFANGGTAVIPTEGYYSAPPMTRIVPNNGNNYGGGGGLTVQIDVHGNVYGMDDLTKQVSRELVPVVAQVIEDARGAQVTI